MTIAASVTKTNDPPRPDVDSARGQRADPGAVAAFEYEMLLENEPPEPEFDFPFGMFSDEYQDAAQARADYEAKEDTLAERAAPYLLKQAEDNAITSSPTGAAIIAEAHRLGVPVEVLGDSEYEERFPGTGGVNSDGTVYLPASGLLDGEHSVLVHEYVHAILGDDLSPEQSLDQRIQACRDTFERLGMDPQEGEWIARATDGWDDGVAAEHVATYYLGAQMEREQQGLPPIAEADRQAFIKRAAQREMALAIERDLDELPEGLVGDLTLVSTWQSWPQGQANPPAGSDIREQAADVRRMLAEYADEADLLPSAPGSGSGSGSKLGD